MAAAAVLESRGMDSPSTFSESQADDDIIFPCKGCGEILEEGKAFELAGNRWHIDCFRCNTCSTLLDSDANLLLLGDGSLICNNCTYSCSACNNKIEDLAILTGDQAFCSACFRCRNCKRKIENLRYARTSQGIFCMSCHESLMARRRKKSTKTTKPAQNGSAAAVKEKALPSLPPGAVPPSAFSPDVETPPSETYSGTPGARSPPERSYYPQRTLSSRGAGGAKRDVSPMSDDARRDGPTLPASTYGDRRPSHVTEEDSDDGDGSGFLPMAFDPNPVAPPIARKAVPRPSDSSPPASDGRPPADYFTRAPPKAAARDARKQEERARSVSTEREPERSTAPSKHSPHILYQEKGRSRKRETSGNNTPASLSGAASPLVATAQEKTKTQQVEAGAVSVNQNEGFKLQEVPKSKKAGSRSNSKAESPSLASPVSPSLNDGSSKDGRSDIAMSNSPVSMTSQHSGVNPFDDPKRREGGGSTPAPPRPVRGDSLAPGAAHKIKQTSPTDPPTPSYMKKAHSVHGRQESTNSATFVDAKSVQSRENGDPRMVDSPPPMRQSFDAPPPRSSSRPTAQSKPSDTFTAPRAPPPLPPAGTHKQNESVSTLQSNDNRGSDGQMSPGLRSAGLPKQSMDGPFSMEDEMARIMRGSDGRHPRQAGEGATSSMMRKVSNAVKHGRSFSDRGLHSAGKSSSSNGGPIEIGSPMNISSPLVASPTGKESYDDLMSQLRRARARITELETDYGALEAKMNSSTEIKAATNELREKRDTIVVLNTQREMVVRELEAMTDHLAKAKDSSTPLDLPALKSELLKDFSDRLQTLKVEMKADIEDLMHKRNQLTEEISKLIQMKDKGFQEYESLTNKNAQLQDMNNQILANIQDTYKANRVPNGSANGLGIYHPGPPKPPSELQTSAEVRNLNLVSTDASMPDLLRETEAEPATVLTAPQVVNIRKGQPKKFNWRKGGERMAKNVTKGIKGAFVSERREGEGPYGNISVPYAQAQQAGPGSDQGSINGRQGLEGNRGQGAGFVGLFGQKNVNLKAGGLGAMKNSSSTNLAVDPSVLFGSELEARCEYEKRLIPAVVSRCIEEVEARGMDMEGVYRKSGGSGQVKTIQMGFEKDGNYDISDPDLDIHAVTSTLKQYFRKLPDPLITYDVYEILLAAGQEKEREKQALALRMAIAELPEHHRDCLEYLVQHLARVVELESMNLMTPLNLAVVFAPTIMRPLSIEREMSDMQAQRVAVQALLENHKVIFDE